MRILNWFKRSKNPFVADDDDDFGRHFVNTHAGVRVTPELAIRLGVVYACVRVISETIATIPLLTYQKRENRKEVNPKDPLFRKLYYRPNPWMSAPDFFKLQMQFLLLRGNAYTEILYKRGEVDKLVPLHPQRVKVELDDRGNKIYKFQMQGGQERVIPFERMLHFKGLSHDGLTGLGVIDDVAKTTVALGLAQEEYGARSFGQRANISGVLQHPGKLDDAAHARIAKSWNQAYSGLHNSHKVAITEEGMTFQPVSMTNEAAQFIESRKFQVEEICRIFRVPPHKVMDLSRAHYNNIEHTSTEFYTDTIVPWATVIEREIDWILIGEDEIDRRFVRFHINSLLRGDTKTRAEVQNIRLNNGMLSINEAREEEDWNPIGPEGDVHRIPLNTGDAAGDTARKPDAEPAEGEDVERALQDYWTRRVSGLVGVASERLRYAHIRSAEDVFGRICRREVAEIRGIVRRNTTFTDETLQSFCEEWTENYRKLVAENIRSLTLSIAESTVLTAQLRDMTAPTEQDCTALAAELTREYAERYGRRSAADIRSTFEPPRAKLLSDLADEYERTRARDEAEALVGFIEARVRAFISAEAA